MFLLRIILVINRMSELPKPRLSGPPGLIIKSPAMETPVSSPVKPLSKKENEDFSDFWDNYASVVKETIKAVEEEER